MINDLNQPAKCWFADALSNFGTLLDAGHEPKMKLQFPGGVELEVRVTCIPGIYQQHTIELPQQDQNPKG